MYLSTRLIQSGRIVFFVSIIFTVIWGKTGFADSPLPVFVSIAPQKYFVQQIGKEKVQVDVMVAPGADPHTYEPRPRQMVALSRARIYFTIGIEFEAVKLQKILSTQPDITVIHTEHGIPKIPMTGHRHHGKSGHEHHHHGHRHEATGPSAHAGHEIMDPHIWLSPPLVMQQARTILDALQQADPANRDYYQTNYEVFIQALHTLHTDLANLFSGQKGLPFMVFHPSWGYFAQAYDLKQVPIELEGKEPKPAQLKKLVEYAKRNRIRVIFAQPQVSAQAARLIAREIQGEVVFIDPLAEDWMQNLRTVAAKFQAARGK